MPNKAKLIRDRLRLHTFDVGSCRHDLIERHPTAWLVEIDGFIVDARGLPPHMLAEVRRRGLVPDLPVAASPAR